MKVSYGWLQDYTSVIWKAEELAEKLTMVGIEVESIEKLAPDLNQVYVGEIKETKPHPNANLQVCAIDIGKEVLTIVCGAPNARPGIKVPVAVVGSVLPNGMKIEAADLRGVQSFGMACSEKELGIGDDDQGLLELHQDCVVGETLVKALGLDDLILDVSIYANRPDCMSMVGIAREIAALVQTKLRYPEFELVESGPDIRELTSIEVEDAEKCPRYSARIIRNVTIKDSPLWMQRRLLAAGMRPINNIVDITNFVMLETGQPLHAFDYDSLAEKRIVVRTPTEAEQTFITLDEIERPLTSDMLMICDANEPVCIGGVMGGVNSGVTEKTKTILLEAANFNALNVRRTARKLAINSEAAARFEKGIDPNGTINALNRAAWLLSEYADGDVTPGIIDIDNTDQKETIVALDPKQVNRLLGTDIDEDFMADILAWLELKVDRSSLPWQVTIPSFRRDLELECDLIEEIARYYGFYHIPVTLPKGSDIGGESFEMALTDKLKSDLVGAGMQEILTYSFINPASLEQSQLQSLPEYTQLIEIANPITKDHAVMRTTLMPSLLACAAYNVNRQQRRLSLFETGSVYLPKQLPLVNRPREEQRLGLFLLGQRWEDHWNLSDDNFDIYDLKGLIEMVLHNFDADFTWQNGSLPIFHPGRQGKVLVGEDVVVEFGEVHPDVQKSYDLPQRAYLAELNLDKLFAYPKAVPHFQVLPKFPVVERDMAVIVSQDVLAGDLIAKLRQAGGEILQTVNVFDVYQGEQVKAGMKSLAFAFVFQADRTLTDDEVNAQIEKMYQAIQQDFGAILR